MIKFFRKIRQNLLAENLPSGRAGKFSKYLLYAAGEIVLVVIGILVALQVNNWNTEQKAGQEELKLLQEMRHNLANDIKDCFWNINKQKELYRSNMVVLRHLEMGIPFHDSLRTHYGNLIYSTTQRRNMAAYSNLKAKGIDLIRNDSLRRNITAVYSERYYYIERQELEYDNTFQMSEVIPQLNAKVILSESSGWGHPIDLEKLQNDDVFKGTLRMNAKIKQFMISGYSNLSNDLNHLITHIEDELEKRKR